MAYNRMTMSYSPIRRQTQNLRLPLFAELLGVEAVGVAASADEFGVAAHFGDGPVFDDRDAVSPFDRGQAGGDDEAGTAGSNRSALPLVSPAG